MSAITRKEVEHVAQLASLALTEEEKDLFAEQLQAILSAINKLNDIDTTGVVPTSHVLPLKNVMRPDKSRPSWSRGTILSQAAVSQDGFFRVPRIMEEE